MASGPPAFVEEAAAAGLSHTYDGEFHFFVGGGVAAFDCDDDMLPDLYLAGGVNSASLYRNESPVGGSLKFSRVPAPVTDLEGVTGAYPLDVDSDGRTDLAVLRLGENVMLRGLGDCRFERANDAWSIDGGDEWTAAFSAKWEPGQAFPTLVFGNYLALDDAGAQIGECSPHTLLRPEGTRYAASTTLAPGWCTLSVLFSDWSGTGRRDLRMTNDRHYYVDGEEQLWEIESGRSPRLYSRDDGWRKMEIWGMGIATQDVTNDGMPEVYLTSQGDNKLQTLAEGPDRPAYLDIALPRGATAHRPFAGDVDRPSTAWHPEFADVNNDGFVDLFITKGNVEAMPEFAANDPNNLLLGQPEGVFVESADEANLLDFSRSRGAAVVDLNLDGWLDVVVVERREDVKMWRNTGTPTGGPSPVSGNWLGLRLRQDGANRDAIGSWVDVRLGSTTMRREATVGGGHAGGQLGWIHFGLGEAQRAEVRITWPDGDVSPWIDLDSNAFWILERGGSEAVEWAPLPD